MSVKKRIADLTVRAPFKDLFPIDPDVLAATVASIKQDGFDPERPIFAWRDGKQLVVVDGHTRLQAAKRARVKEVPVVARRFAGEEQAFAFAVAAQRDRRNLTKLEIAEAIARAEVAGTAFDFATPARSIKGGGGRGGARGSTKDPVRTAVVEKAAKVGVGTRTADKALANVRASNGTKPKAKPSKTDTAQKAFDAWTKKHRRPLIPLVGDYEKLINKVGPTAARRGSDLAFELALQAHREGKTTDELFHTVTLEI